MVYICNIGTKEIGKRIVQGHFDLHSEALFHTHMQVCTHTRTSETQVIKREQASLLEMQVKTYELNTNST